MALKYQALNGAVINNTLTIEGANPLVGGSPAICNGFYTKNKKFRFAFIGCGTTTSAISTPINVYQTSGAALPSIGINKNMLTAILQDNDGNYITGIPANALYFIRNGYSFDSSSTSDRYDFVCKVILYSISSKTFRTITATVSAIIANQSDPYVYNRFQINMNTNDELICYFSLEPTT